MQRCTSTRAGSASFVGGEQAYRMSCVMRKNDPDVPTNGFERLDSQPNAKTMTVFVLKLACFVWSSDLHQSRVEKIVYLDQC